MNPSPVGSRILSGYAVLFAGLAPICLALAGLAHGVGMQLLGSVVLGVAIAYYGMRVFIGEPTVIKLFAVLVMIHYLSLTATNLWNYESYPADSRAAEMAIPRMLRGILFAAVYGWYYLLRSKTLLGFGVTKRCS